MIKLVCNPMINNGKNTWIAQQHLIHAMCCWIALIGSTDISIQQTANLRQGIGKILHNGLGQSNLLLVEQMVITGDITQIDLPKGKKSGLVEAAKILKPVKDIRFCYLKDVDVVRHELVKKIINAYEKYYQEHPKELEEE